MSEISIVNESNTIEILSEDNIIEISKPVYSIEVAIAGTQGVKGEGVPAGGVAGQVLAKINSTDYNTEWADPSDTGSVSWIDVAGDVEYTGVETPIASGDVLTADYKGGTVYRFINSTNNTNGYPVEDSFYSDFDGTNLTNLIVTRGQ